MSILIKGMEIPKDYSVIVKIFPDGRVGAFPYVQRFKVDLIPGTQAVSVPPHGRLIDADALCKTLHSLAEREYTPEVFANWIENHIDSVIPSEEV